MAVLASVAMGTSHDKEANKAKMKGFVEQAAAQNGDLIVFPEYVLAGLPENPMFVFNPDDARYQHENAELVPEGPSTQYFIDLAQQNDIYIAWGMVEQDPDDWDIRSEEHTSELQSPS